MDSAVIGEAHLAHCAVAIDSSGPLRAMIKSLAYSNNAMKGEACLRRARAKSVARRRRRPDAA
jgi:hypothetical protein